MLTLIRRVALSVNRLGESKLQIEGITFDFGGTITYGELEKEEFRSRLINYLKSQGYSAGLAKLEKARREMLRGLISVRRLHREIRLEDLYQDLLFKLGLHPDIEILNHIHRLYIRSFNIRLVPGVEEVLKALNVNYRLAVVSNAMSNVARHAIKKYKLERYFDTVVISRDIGIRKPDPEIFNFTLENLGTARDKTIHVGNSLEEDVEGATRAGMKAIWIGENSGVIDIRPDHIVQNIEELVMLL